MLIQIVFCIKEVVEQNIAMYKYSHLNTQIITSIHTFVFGQIEWIYQKN